MDEVTSILSTRHQSALAELRRQLTQSYALVTGARTALMASDNPEETVAPELLDMAQDVLSELQYICRMDELLPKKEVNHG